MIKFYLNFKKRAIVKLNLQSEQTSGSEILE